MELIRKAVGYAWTPSSSDSQTMKNMTRQVTEEEWLSSDEEFYNNMDGGYQLIETNPEDMAKIEELLGVKKGFFGDVPIVIKTSQQFCPSCSRENNFLDVVTTGLKVHSAEFLVDVFSGKYGHILNTQQDQRCFCYQCKTLLPKTAAKYSAPKVDGQMYYRWRWPF